jgi:hypothetical protein
MLDSENHQIQNIKMKKEKRKSSIIWTIQCKKGPTNVHLLVKYNQEKQCGAL